MDQGGKRMKESVADAASVRTKTTKLTKGTLRTLEERNPYNFIEKALLGAKQRLNDMKNT